MNKIGSNFENIQSFLTVNWEPEILCKFLMHVFNDLRKKCGQKYLNLYSFRDFLCLPMVITERLFCILNTSKTRLLSKTEFVKGLTCLYLGRIEEKITFVFRLFDFNCDSIITLDNITLLLSHFHMVSQVFDEISALEEIIRNSFVHAFSWDLKSFSETIFTKSSDIFFLTLCFLIKYIPLTNNQIQAFQLTTGKQKYCSENEKIFSKLAQPSTQLLQYVKKLTFIREDNNDSETEIKELEKFEHNVEEVFSKWNDGALEKCVEKNEVREEITFRQYSKFQEFFMKKRANLDVIISRNSSVKDLSCSNNLMNYTFSSKNPNYSEDREHEIILFCNLNGILAKCKLTLVDDCLFYYSIHQENVAKFKKIISLRSIYVKKCFALTIGDKTYFPFQLVSCYDGKQMTMTFLSIYQDEVLYFIQSIKKSIYCRRIQDYYSIGNTILKGNLFKMKLATNKITREKVLIKIISKIENEESYKMLVTEKDLFSFFKYFSHPGIIKPIDMFEKRKKVLFVYEYISDDYLRAYLLAREDEITSLDVINYPTQILDSVELLHKTGNPQKDNLISSNNDEEIILKIKDIKYSNMGSCGTSLWNVGVLINLLALGVNPFRVAISNLQKIQEGIVNNQLYFPSSSSNLEIFGKILHLIKACHL